MQFSFIAEADNIKDFPLEQLELWDGHFGLIFKHFDSNQPVGEVTHAYIEKGSLMVEGIMYFTKEELFGSDDVDMFVVVSYMLKRNEEGNEEVYKPSIYGLTDSPMNSTIKPVEVLL